MSSAHLVGDVGEGFWCVGARVSPREDPPLLMGRAGAWVCVGARVPARVTAAADGTRRQHSDNGDRHDTEQRSVAVRTVSTARRGDGSGDWRTSSHSQPFKLSRSSLRERFTELNWGWLRQLSFGLEHGECWVTLITFE